jgi:hypothetical protein
MGQPLDTGTLIECDIFSGIVIADDCVLVFHTEVPEYVNESELVSLSELGSNDWALHVSGTYGDRIDFWVRRDWNGVVSTLDAPDPWFDNEWDDDYDYYWIFGANVELYEAYDDYRSLSSPAHSPRSRKAAADRNKSDGRRRR